MIESALILTVLTIMLLASFAISGLLARRAMYQVIDKFCHYDALQASKAKTAEEFGLAPRDFFQRLFRPRDYKPYAVRFLKKAGAIRMTQEGKLYLVEEKLGDNLKCKRS